MWLLFPETKRYSLEELDLVFAVAHESGENPVAVSLSGDIPAAGSPEAERILGRAPAPQRRESFGRRLSRVISGQSGKGAVHHTE